MIRVESEETQNCVLELRGRGDVSPEEVEETRFVPSTLSEPRGAAHWCDCPYSEHGFKSHQIAAMVTEEGGEAHTINLCKRCYSERLVRQGKQPAKAAESRDCRAKSIPWQAPSENFTLSHFVDDHEL